MTIKESNMINEEIYEVVLSKINEGENALNSLFRVKFLLERLSFLEKNLTSIVSEEAKEKQGEKLISEDGVNFCFWKAKEKLYFEPEAASYLENEGILQVFLSQPEPKLALSKTSAEKAYKGKAISLDQYTALLKMSNVETTYELAFERIK